MYARSGERVALVEWPQEVELMLGYLERSEALGIHRDSLGVERVAQRRFTP